MIRHCFGVLEEGSGGVAMGKLATSLLASNHVKTTFCTLMTSILTKMLLCPDQHQLCILTHIPV